MTRQEYLQRQLAKDEARMNRICARQARRHQRMEDRSSLPFLSQTFVWLLTFGLLGKRR